MSELHVNRIAVLESQLLDEYRRNSELREQLARLDEVQAGPTCKHCRKPVKRDGDGNWRCLDFRLWCGVGDARHSLDIGAGETQRVTMVRS